jgi:hypothetical protein
LVYKDAGFRGILTYQRSQAHLPQQPNQYHQIIKSSPNQTTLRATTPHKPTHQINQYSTMVHPFLIDQKAYLNRVSSSSASSTSSSTQTTYEQFKQSTSSTTHLFGSVSPCSSRLSVTSQTSQQDEMDLEMERKMKQERRRGVIGRLF